MSAVSTRIPGGMPSTTTPTAGPCDSPNVVTRNSSPNEEDMLLAALRARPAPGRLRGDERRVRALAELEVVGDQLLELVEVRRAPRRARFRNPRLAAIPRDDVLARVIEEHLRVQQPAVHERGDHLPVRDRHPEVAILVGVREVALLDLGPRGGIELGEEPATRQAQLGFAADLVKLEQQFGVGGDGLAHRAVPRVGWGQRRIAANLTSAPGPAKPGRAVSARGAGAIGGRSGCA